MLDGDQHRSWVLSPAGKGRNLAKKDSDERVGAIRASLPVAVSGLNGMVEGGLIADPLA
jgi:hypothetical protein